MAITDWTINKSALGTIATGIDPTIPVVGTGSLRIIDFDNGTMNMYNNTYFRGLTRGRMRMLVQLRTETSSLGDDFYNIGMYVMSDNDDITVPDSFGQTFYSLSLGYDVFTNNHVISLDYHDNAIEDVPLNLFTSAAFTITHGQDIVPLELEWKLEPEFGPGILFTVRGSTTPSTLTDFTNLTTLTEFVHNDPATTSLSASSEGIYFEGLGGSLPSGVDALIDQFSLFSIARV